MHIFCKSWDKIENCISTELWNSDCDIHSHTQKIYGEKFNMNSNTKFDPKLHLAQIILSLSILNDLRNAGISVIDKFFKIFCRCKSCSNFMQLPDVLNGVIALIRSIIEVNRSKYLLLY